MSDKYINITSFRYGLDKRRQELVSQVGTLSTLVNGHINSGGEIEKRKAYSLFYSLAVLDDEPSPGPYQGVFWIESTDGGLKAFGSALAYTGGARPHTLGQAMLVSALVDIGYVQLAHPAVLEGETYDPAKYRMTEVKFSVNFAGKAFVCAKFSDGNSFLYFDGVLVYPSRNGLVLYGRDTANELAVELAAEVNRLSGWSGAATTNYVDVKTPPGVNNVAYSPSDTDATNSITVQHIADESAGVTGNPPVANFTVTSLVSGAAFTITAPGPGGVGTVTILPATTVNSADPAVAATAIINGINSTQTTPKYIAALVTNTTTGITISGPAGDTTLNAGTLTVSWTGTAVIGAASYGGTVSDASVQKVAVYPAGASGNKTVTTPATTALPIGGTGPFTYLWEFVSGDVTLAPVSPTLATTTFKGTVFINGDTKTAVWRCKITDTGAGSAVVYTNNVTAYIEATNLS